MMSPEEQIRQFYKAYTIEELPVITSELLDTLLDVYIRVREISRQFIEQPAKRKREKEHFELDQYISKNTVKKIILRSNDVTKNGDFVITDSQLITYMVSMANRFSDDNWLLGHQPKAGRSLSVLFTIVGMCFEFLHDLKSQKIPDQFIVDFISWSKHPANSDLENLSLSAYKKAHTRFKNSKWNK